MSQRQNLINNLIIGYNSDLAKARKLAINSIEFVSRTSVTVAIIQSKIQTIMAELTITEANIQENFNKNMEIADNKYFSDEE